MKVFLKKITGYTWAFILLVAVFFATGIFTLGNVRSSGDAFYMKANKAAYYTLNLEDGDKLSAVYVNVGSIYNEVGETAAVTVKICTSSSSPTTSSYYWKSFGESLTVSNVYSGADDSVNGGNFNWTPVVTGQSKSTVKKISLTASVNLDLNEIVCLNQDGEKISLTTYSPSGWSDADKYETAEMSKAIDAQNSFTTNKNSYYNLTQEEAYYMTSVRTVLSGNEILDGCTYTLDSTFNYLATLLYAPSVAMFGNSAFALRLPTFIAACCLLVFAYLLLRELTKNEKLSFAFAVVLALGGMLTTVGRIGAPYTIIVSALVASVYFMYRFFAHGISSKRIVKGGLNVLVSGLFAAVAMAMDITAVIPVIGVLVLFGFGLRRQKLAHELALKKTEGQEETLETEEGEAVVINRAELREKAVYEEKKRISYGFAALSFVMATLVLILVSGVLCYSAFVKAYDEPDLGFLLVLWRGIAESMNGTMTTDYLASNLSNVFAWFVPAKAATLYSVSAEGEYLAWNVLPNAVATYASLAAFIGVTVKVVIDFVKKNTDKKSLRVRRTYFLLVGAMALAMLAGMVRQNVSAEAGLLFHVFYLGFLPLAATLLPETCKGKKGKILANIAIWTVVVLVAAVFVLSLPSMYGFAVSANWTKAFGWTAWLNNGFFR